MFYVAIFRLPPTRDSTAWPRMGADAGRGLVAPVPLAARPARGRLALRRRGGPTGRIVNDKTLVKFRPTFASILAECSPNVDNLRVLYNSS